MKEIKRDFIGEAKNSFTSTLPLREVSLEAGLKKIEVEGGSIDLAIFKAEKIEKIVFSTIKIHSSSVSEESVLIWPDDAHDLPIFWCNLTQMPGMNIPIFDFIPLMDIVVWPQYAENYLTELREAKNKVLDIFQETITDKAFELPSLVAHTLSPYKLLLMLTDTGVARVPQAINEYVQAYIRCWNKAEPLTQNDERNFYIRKKNATRKLMKENDPGYPLMVNIFGEENTRKVFDLIF